MQSIVITHYYTINSQLYDAEPTSTVPVAVDGAVNKFDAFVGIGILGRLDKNHIITNRVESLSSGKGYNSNIITTIMTDNHRCINSD